MRPPPTRTRSERNTIAASACVSLRITHRFGTLWSLTAWLPLMGCAMGNHGPWSLMAQNSNQNPKILDDSNG